MTKFRVTMSKCTLCYLFILAPKNYDFNMWKLDLLIHYIQPSTKTRGWNASSFINQNLAPF